MSVRDETLDRRFEERMRKNLPDNVSKQYTGNIGNYEDLLLLRDLINKFEELVKENTLYGHGMWYKLPEITKVSVQDCKYTPGEKIFQISAKGFEFGMRI